MTTSTQPCGDTTGSTSWTNPNNALTNDADYAVSPSTGTNTTSGFWQGLNPFGTNPLPAAATIDGIEIAATGKCAVANAASFFIYQATLRKGGTQYSGSSVAGSANFTATTDQTRTVPSSGGSTALWGLSGVTGADLNDPTFGIRLPLRNGWSSAQAFSLKYVTVTAYYTYAGVQSSQQQILMCEF